MTIFYKVYLYLYDYVLGGYAWSVVGNGGYILGGGWW